MRLLTLGNFYAMSLVTMSATVSIALAVLNLSQEPGLFLAYGVVGALVVLLVGVLLETLADDDGKVRLGAGQ